MKTQSTLMSLAGLIVVAGLIAAPLRAEPPELKTKPLKDHGIQIHRTDVLPGSFQQEYFQGVRAEKGRVEDSATVILVRGNNNLEGQYTEVGYQTIYIEMEDGIPVLDVHFWSEYITDQGDKYWVKFPILKAYPVGPKAGTSEGEWELVDGTGRFSGITGAGKIVAFAHEDGMWEHEATGWASTVGSSK